MLDPNNRTADQICKNCRAYVKREETSSRLEVRDGLLQTVSIEIGSCHQTPPVSGYMSQVKGGFQTVNAEDWCGSFLDGKRDDYAICETCVWYDPLYAGFVEQKKYDGEVGDNSVVTKVNKTLAIQGICRINAPYTLHPSPMRSGFPSVNGNDFCGQYQKVASILDGTNSSEVGFGK